MTNTKKTLIATTLTLIMLLSLASAALATAPDGYVEPPYPKHGYVDMTGDYGTGSDKIIPSQNSISVEEWLKQNKGGTAQPQQKALAIYINNQKVVFPDTQPYINKDSRTMIPIRFIAENLKNEVNWFQETSTVTIKGNGEELTLRVNSKEVNSLQKGKVTLDTQPENKDSRVLVPLRFISEAMGHKVDYVDGEVFITKTEAEPEEEPQETEGE